MYVYMGVCLFVHFWDKIFGIGNLGLCLRAYMHIYRLYMYMCKYMIACICVHVYLIDMYTCVSRTHVYHVHMCTWYTCTHVYTIYAYVHMCLSIYVYKCTWVHMNSAFPKCFKRHSSKWLLNANAKLEYYVLETSFPHMN